MHLWPATGVIFKNNLKFVNPLMSKCLSNSLFAFYGHPISHYNKVIMSLMASQITSLMIVYSTVYSGADKKKHQSSASLAFVRGIHRWPVNCPHKGPVTRKMFPFDEVIMITNKPVDQRDLPFGQGFLVAGWQNNNLPVGHYELVWIIIRSIIMTNSDKT